MYVLRRLVFGVLVTVTWCKVSGNFMVVQYVPRVKSDVRLETAVPSAVSLQSPNFRVF